VLVIRRQDGAKKSASSPLPAATDSGEHRIGPLHPLGRVEVLRKRLSAIDPLAASEKLPRRPPAMHQGASRSAVLAHFDVRLVRLWVEYRARWDPPYQEFPSTGLSMARQTFSRALS